MSFQFPPDRNSRPVSDAPPRPAAPRGQDLGRWPAAPVAQGLDAAMDVVVPPKRD